MQQIAAPLIGCKECDNYLSRAATVATQAFLYPPPGEIVAQICPRLLGRRCSAPTLQSVERIAKTSATLNRISAAIRTLSGKALTVSDVLLG